VFSDADRELGVSKVGLSAREMEMTGGRGGPVQMSTQMGRDGLVGGMSTGVVAQWLQSVDLGWYQNAFIAQNITGRSLAELCRLLESEPDLFYQMLRRELKIEAFGDALTFAAELRNLVYFSSASSGEVQSSLPQPILYSNTTITTTTTSSSLKTPNTPNFKEPNADAAPARETQGEEGVGSGTQWLKNRLKSLLGIEEKYSENLENMPSVTGPDAREEGEGKEAVGGNHQAGEAGGENGSRGEMATERRKRLQRLRAEAEAVAAAAAEAAAEAVGGSELEGRRAAPMQLMTAQEREAGGGAEGAGRRRYVRAVRGQMRYRTSNVFNVRSASSAGGTGDVSRGGGVGGGEARGDRGRAESVGWGSGAPDSGTRAGDEREREGGEKEREVIGLLELV
jgi:hypothetical protein